MSARASTPADRVLTTGTGLGLRRELIAELRESEAVPVDFLEIAPENWMAKGGRSREDLDWFAARYPLVCHGLSLSLGGLEPLDRAFVGDVGRFLDAYRIPLYTEHLSYCGDAHHFYDLLPIPFTDEAVRHVAARIGQIQDMLGRRIGVENVSYYLHAPICTMSEIQFVNAVVAEADCLLHLDVNNVYVNSVNHGFDPYAWLDAMPAERVTYMHIAGHDEEAPDLLIDTHGQSVAHPVWRLLDHALRCTGPTPVLLERDFNIPPLSDLVAEIDGIRRCQAAALTLERAA